MHAPLRVLVGSLAPGVLPTTAGPDLPNGTILLNLGDDHPSRAGLLELRLWTQDDMITTAEIVVGAMHRGAEKLFEVRDYRQIMMLADRHDWQAPFAGELMIALACERALGLEVPERAVWLRMLLAEHTRIQSHLGFLGFVTRTRGGESLTPLRERLRGQLQALTGNRIHPMITRLGGLAADASDSWLADEADVLDLIMEQAASLEEMIMTDSFAERSAGVAPLTPDTIREYGVSGPAARASGVDLDRRLRDPYLAYETVAHLITAPPPATGDAQGRFLQLAREVQSSISVSRACIERLSDLTGPVDVRLPKIIKLPEGETYIATEGPLGTTGCLIISRGEKTPWRLKLRTASFNNVAALEAMLPGCAVVDLEMTLASMGYVVGDIDK